MKKNRFWRTYVCIRCGHRWSGDGRYLDGRGCCECGGECLPIEE